MDSGDLLGKWPTDRKLGHADVPTDGSLGQSLRQALSYALLVLLPLGMSWPVGAPAASNVLTAYVTPVLYPSDLVLVPLLLVVLASAARRFRRRLGAERRNAGRVDRHPESHAGPTQVAGGCLHAVHGSFGLPLLALALLAALTSPLAIAPSLAAYNAARWLLACAAYLAVSDSRVPVGKLAMVLVAVWVSSRWWGWVRWSCNGRWGCPWKWPCARRNKERPCLWRVECVGYARAP